MYKNNIEKSLILLCFYYISDGSSYEHHEFDLHYNLMTPPSPHPNIPEPQNDIVYTTRHTTTEVSKIVEVFTARPHIPEIQKPELTKIHHYISEPHIPEVFKTHHHIPEPKNIEVFKVQRYVPETQSSGVKPQHNIPERTVVVVKTHHHIPQHQHHETIKTQHIRKSYRTESIRNQHNIPEQNERKLPPVPTQAQLSVRRQTLQLLHLVDGTNSAEGAALLDLVRV